LSSHLPSLIYVNFQEKKTFFGVLNSQHSLYKEEKRNSKGKFQRRAGLLCVRKFILFFETCEMQKKKKRKRKEKEAKLN
jgi:hypothetical protein